MSVKPITPQELVSIIPEEVIESINELLKEKYTGGRSIINLPDIISRTLSKMPDDTVFKNEWVDIEGMYGKWWYVECVLPKYAGDVYFTFTPRT